MWHVCYTPINYINQNYKCEWMAQPASSATLISWICNTHIHPQFAHTAPHATWVKYTQNSFFLLSRFELHAFDARYSSWYVLTVVAMLMSVEKKSHFSTKWKVHTLRLTLVRYGGNCLHHSSPVLCCLNTAIEANTFHLKMIRAYEIAWTLPTENGSRVFSYLYSLESRRANERFNSMRRFFECIQYASMSFSGLFIFCGFIFRPLLYLSHGIW